MDSIQQIDAAVARLTAPGQMFALEDLEIRGHHYRGYVNQPPDLAAYYALMNNHAAKDWVVHGVERYTYAEGLQHAAEFATALQQRYRVGKGDRVAIAMRNNPQWMMAFMGITALGAIAVPMNSWWTTEELDYGLRDSGARLVVVDPDRAARLQPIAADLGLGFIGVGDFAHSGVEVEDFMGLLQEFAGASMPATDSHPDDDIIIMYTSGSTGHPKGAVCTHRGVLAAIFSWLLMGNAAKEVAGAGEGDGDTHSPSTLMTVPLFHTTGSHSLFLLSLVIGRKIVLMHKWDVQEAMRLIEAERVTNFNGVPTMSAELQAAARESTYDLSSLREIFSGGAARPPDQVGKIAKTFQKSSAGSGYGLTETNALGAVNTGAFYVANPASTGRVVPAVTDFRIVDDGGREQPVGERGEVCIRSPANVRGYWNKPEATRAAFVDGWFHSGDIGYMDAQGFLYIVGRIKEIIIRGGENISCIEVESAIHQHEAVAEAAVFGLPDERLGEVVAAALVLREGAVLDAPQLQAFLGDHLAAFKIPQHIWVRAEQLPRIASGKIFKRQLQADYAAELAN
jgi:acyl-CoA synthetase (AMP-forming)/AMP-acid ligase II